MLLQENNRTGCFTANPAEDVTECVHAHRCARISIMEAADDLPGMGKSIFVNQKKIGFVQLRFKKYSCSVFRKIMLSFGRPASV
jgi:hypothetical protein